VPPAFAVERTDSTLKRDPGEVNGAAMCVEKAAQRTDSTLKWDPREVNGALVHAENAELRST
jgi:hypothetical protein